MVFGSIQEVLKSLGNFLHNLPDYLLLMAAHLSTYSPFFPYPDKFGTHLRQLIATC